MDLKYKLIPIQKLEDRPQKSGEYFTNKQLNSNLNRNFRWAGKDPLYYADTGVSNKRIIPHNGLMRTSSFFQAFYDAYINHGDIVLIPDQIWLMVCFYISKYIDDHAQILRSKLVKHQGKKQLVVTQVFPNGTETQTDKAEKKWDQFFESILQLIRKNTLQGVTQAFQCDFSTTTRDYKVISTALIMNSFKNLFGYTRFFAGCGINNVYMAGNRFDWAKMIKKLSYMEQFDVNGQLKEYISHMKIILSNFLSTFDQKPDIQWWNTVMKTSEKRRVYGGEEMEVEGWILHFFGIYDKKTMSSMPDFGIQVPIKLVNDITKKTKNLFLVSNWTSISKLSQKAYKPDVGLSIVVAKQEQKK